MTRPHVAWIHTAPIKALAIQERERVHLGKLGVAGDRRFCVVDPESGVMLNGKRIPVLVAIRPTFSDDSRHLALDMPDGSRVAGDVALGEPLTITIFGRACEARIVTGPFSDALSTQAGRPLRLVRLEREGDGIDRADEAGAASVLSQESLRAIGAAAGATEPVDPRRFRMLIGVADVPAHTEDTWIGSRVRVGEAVLVPVGNVGRCAVTSVDPRTGRANLDTLAALAKYRGETASTERLPFGVWARIAEPGTVALGDDVTV